LAIALHIVHQSPVFGRIGHVKGCCIVLVARKIPHFLVFLGVW